MASEMPPAAERQQSLPAQHNKRLMLRLAAWGGAAVFSLAAAVIVSQTGTANKRVQVALSDDEPPYESAASAATATIAIPKADLTAVKRATGRTAAKLAEVERHTAQTRAETKRLAVQVSKLSADSFRVTGRLANIESQIGSITGAIKKHVEDAVAEAVGKARPGASDVTAPNVSPPATTLPKLSLIEPETSDSNATSASNRRARSEGDASTGDKAAQKTNPEVTTTSSIARADGKRKDQARVAAKAEGKAASGAKPMAKAPAKPKELRPKEIQAEHAAQMKAASKAKPEKETKPKKTAALHGKPAAKPMAKAEPEPDSESGSKQPAGAETKTASVTRSTHRRVSQHWVPTRGYGIDLGGADSIEIAKAQWAAVKANFSPVLGGMRPLVVRNHRLLSRGDYRLVAGQTYSLKIAQRICERLALQQVTCQPVEFDDGRMVWR